jgi:cell volume regulation protein A
VALLLVPFKFSVREQALISWVGLKGAVPIILAMFPLIFGHPEGRLLFNVVFFVVLVSATLQGWTLPTFARWLRLQEPVRAIPSVSLELLSLRDVDADVVDYVITPDSPVAGRTVEAIGLPDGAIVAAVLRDGTLIAPKGPTLVQAGDHLFVISRTPQRDSVDRLFDATAKP